MDNAASMRARSFASVASLLGVAACLVAPEASAAETAVYCSDLDRTCETAPIAFSKEVVLPVQAGFDTGWVPQNSPLQVHLWAQLWANSRIDLAGDLETTWPEALTLETIPTPGAGNMSIHYGVDIGAQASVSITVLGQTFNWTGDIPYVPQFDFQVEASNAFDPWAFEGVSVNGSTMEATIAQVSVESFLPLDIPGLDGGFELNTYIDLTATYRTTQIEITRLPDGTLVEGGEILSEDDTTTDLYSGETSVDYAVRPVGEVVYDGVLHLIPAFYIETIGPDFSIPIADIPIPFQFVQKDWEFDPAEVHVPLPDLELEEEGADVDPDEVLIVDLGEVALGDAASTDIALANLGDALLAGGASLAVAGPEDISDFSLTHGVFEIDPGAEAPLSVTFSASEPGEFAASLIVASNDPDEPVRTLEVRARVVDPQDIDDGDGDGDDDGGDVLDDAFPRGGGCACEIVDGGASSRGTFAFVAFAALALTAVGRKKRR